MTRLSGRRLSAIALVMPMLFSAQAWGEAAGTATPQAAVAAQDAALNAVFFKVRDGLSGEARQRLLDEQRQWIKTRNLECGLDAKEASDSHWPANLAAQKAECVLRMTRARTQLLAAPQEPVARLDAFSDKAQMSPLPEFTFPVGHTSGKWYAEVMVERSVAQSAADLGLQIGIDNASGFYAIGLGKAKLPPDQPVEVVGLMVDVDRRVMNWRTVSDAYSEEGIPLAVGTRPFAVKVRAARDLEALLKRGQVKVNYGQLPFKFPTPPGYSPWYYSRDAEDPVRWLVPPFERTAGQDVKQTAQGFWRWLLTADPAGNPTQDRTGGSCAARQQGQLWFLAGAEASARIERTCTVPFGSNLVIPVISLLLSNDVEGVCAKTVEVARLAPHTIQDSFLEIDGRRFDRLQDYSATEVSCGPLSVNGQQLTKQANWLGLWVTLQPLPRGEHIISFGGRVKAINADRKVTYRLLVN